MRQSEREYLVGICRTIKRVVADKPEQLDSADFKEGYGQAARRVSDYLGWLLTGRHSDKELKKHAKYL